MISMPEDSSCPHRIVRGILGRWGPLWRVSAPTLDIVAEGQSLTDAWVRFLHAMHARKDHVWYSFDIGFTRPEEISQALDAPEDESWNERLSGRN